MRLWHTWNQSRTAGVGRVAGGCVYLYFLLTAAHEWVVWRSGVDDANRQQVVAEIAGRDLSLVDVVNWSISFALIIPAFIFVVGTLLQGAQWLTRRGRNASYV